MSSALWISGCGIIATTLSPAHWHTPVLRCTHAHTFVYCLYLPSLLASGEDRKTTISSSTAWLVGGRSGGARLQNAVNVSLDLSVDWTPLVAVNTVIIWFGQRNVTLPPFKVVLPTIGRLFVHLFLIVSWVSRLHELVRQWCNCTEMLIVTIRT